jgi:hypothetical protein
MFDTIYTVCREHVPATMEVISKILVDVQRSPVA